MPSDMQILHGTWEYSDSTASSEFPAAKRRAMFSATTCACWTARRAAFWFCVSATSPIANTVGYAASASCRVGRTEMKPSDVRHPGASVRSGADIGVWPVARILGRGGCRSKMKQRKHVPQDPRAGCSRSRDQHQIRCRQLESRLLGLGHAHRAPF